MFLIYRLKNEYSVDGEHKGLLEWRKVFVVVGERKKFKYLIMLKMNCNLFHLSLSLLLTHDPLKNNVPVGE